MVASSVATHTAHIQNYPNRRLQVSEFSRASISTRINLHGLRKACLVVPVSGCFPHGLLFIQGLVRATFVARRLVFQVNLIHL